MLRTKRSPVQYPSSITKEEINQLPLIEYSGPTHVIDSQEKLDAHIASIRKEKVLGFDTETKPSFTRNDNYLPSLIQIATAKEVFLIQIARIKDPDKIASIFSDESILKVGVALRDDVAGLMKVFPFQPKGFFDLAELARLAGIVNTGLRSLCAITLKHRISKSVQVSNWARSDLTAKQIIYAATDAWISREIYVAFNKAGYTPSAKPPRKSPEINEALSNRIRNMGLASLKRHILFCHGDKACRCAHSQRSAESYNYLRRRLQQLKLLNEGGVLLSEVNCLHICQKGPVMLVYPEGTWYWQCSPDVIEAILQSHILKGKPLKEHALINRKLK